MVEAFERRESAEEVLLSERTPVRGHLNISSKAVHGDPALEGDLYWEWLGVLLELSVEESEAREWDSVELECPGAGEV